METLLLNIKNGNPAKLQV
uniref:Uncharacterized protein n=1 Tax=Lepeophtheirus salmonis TaxID=72036 RepID=A0A0K2VCJ1_LEPSM